MSNFYPSTNMAPEVLNQSEAKDLSYEDRVQIAMNEYRKGGTSLRGIAQTFGVNRNTLKNRLDGVPSTAAKATSRQRLTPAEEEAIIESLYKLWRWGWPARVQDLKTMISSIFKEKGDLEPMGENFYKKFLNRHPVFKTKYASRIEQNRLDAVDVDSVTEWFQLYQQTCNEYKISEADRYNMDDKGFALGVADSIKVLVPWYDAKALTAQPGNRDWASIIEFIPTSGWRPPPFIIFEGKSVQFSWAKGIQLDQDTVLRVSLNGWTTREIGLEWIEFFDKHTKPHTQGTYRLLIFDGHDSHCTIQFVRYCEEKNIIPLRLAPHTTHILQPLDVGIFGPLTKAYKKRVHEHTRFGAVNISKNEFLRFYLDARREAINTQNVKSAWRATGLLPFNSAHVLEKIRPKTPPHASLTDSFGRHINVTFTTEHAVQTINDLVGSVVDGISPSKRPQLLELGQRAEKATAEAEKARAEKVIAHELNEAMVESMKNTRKRANKKGGNGACKLTVKDLQAAEDEAIQKAAAQEAEKERKRALRGVVGFAKEVWKVYKMTEEVFQ